jgi:PAS domain S-box-containing protein
MRFDMIEISGGLARSLLDAAPDATVIADASGIVVFANAHIETTFGYTPEELIGRPVETLIPERLRNGHAAHRSRFFASPSSRPMGAAFELFGLHRDGHEFPVEVSLSPLQTPAGTLVSSAIRDISERKAIEAALVAARIEADRANRAKSAFLAAASHDLRQPLQTLALLNTALGRISPPDSRAANIATRTEEALDSMSELLNSLLDISKLEAGAVRPDIRDASIRQIFERLRHRFSGLAEAKGIELLVDDCEDVVHTDPTLLEQIVQNLVANAIRYTQRGLVELRCFHTSSIVRIEVLDTGIGIAPEEIDLVFEEFYQTPASQGRRREGLGLGLSIVRRVAELLEISIAVESKPGSGSRFCVSVPRGDKAAVERAHAAPADQTAARSHAAVLVIDDDAAVADATATLLETCGYSPVVATNLATAKTRLASMPAPPGLFICDFHLSLGPTGPETIRELRSLAGRTIPALLVTGDTTREVQEIAAGLDDCVLLSKPIVGDQLVTEIRRLLG